MLDRRVKQATQHTKQCSILSARRVLARSHTHGRVLASSAALHTAINQSINPPRSRRTARYLVSTTIWKRKSAKRRGDHHRVAVMTDMNVFEREMRSERTGQAKTSHRLAYHLGMGAPNRDHTIESYLRAETSPADLRETACFPTWHRCRIYQVEEHPPLTWRTFSSTLVLCSRSVVGPSCTGLLLLEPVGRLGLGL